MNYEVYFQKFLRNRGFVFLFTVAFTAVIFISSSITVFAQAKLSFADILIALRSKRATIEKKNELLTEAVKVRGVSFSLTPEIEKELQDNGANTALVAVIREKGGVVKPVIEKTPEPEVKAEPEFTLLQKQGDSYMVKGDYDLAVVFYTRSIESNPKNADAYFSRGLANYNKNFYDLAINDFSKGLELNPAEAIAYFHRGDSYERINETEKALADYKKSVELNANNDRAKAAIKRVQVEVDKILLAKAEQARIEQANAERARLESQRIANSQNNNNTPRVAPKTETQQPRETPANQNTTAAKSDLGTLTSENAVSMATPVYPPEARRYRVEGQVRVQVEIDAQGNVTSAKATSGPGFLRAAAENAASRSKFKTGLSNGTSTGIILYNFKL